jgi:hypothetical protein
MKPLIKKPTQNLKPPNIITNNYKCYSLAIEKHVLGALVKCRQQLYNPNTKPTKGDMTSKEKEVNYKASLILNEIMNSPNCPKELQDLNCTVFFLTKGGGYQFWGNYKHYISASFGDDTILILLN